MVLTDDLFTDDLFSRKKFSIKKGIKKVPLLL